MLQWGLLLMFLQTSGTLLSKMWRDLAKTDLGNLPLLGFFFPPQGYINNSILLLFSRHLTLEIHVNVG